MPTEAEKILKNKVHNFMKEAPPLRREGRPSMNEDLLGRVTHCTVCTDPIPHEAAKHRATTCGKGCYDLLKRMRRKPKDDRQCRFCQRPATLSQRQAWRRFRDWEAEYPDIAHPKTWAVLQAAGMDLDTFKLVGKEADEQDFSLEYAAAPLLWHRKPVKAKADHPNLDRAMAILREHWAAELEHMTPPEPAAE